MDVNLLFEKALVQYRTGKGLTGTAIAKLVDDLGFGATVISDAEVGKGEKSDGSHDVSLTIGNTSVHLVLGITGMTCSACSNSIESCLKSKEGVVDVSISHVLNRGEIIFDRYVRRSHFINRYLSSECDVREKDT
mgnify:FL=1